MRWSGGGRARVPEVVQSSGMDCGPAALSAFLRGLGVPASYPRLREVCQTDVDGTSIDVLEETACALGAPVEQVVVPAEFVIADPRNTPAVAVTVLPGGFTHFVVACAPGRRHVRVMDPAVGHRRIDRSTFTAELFEYPLEVDPDEWFGWASTDDFLTPMRARLRQMGVSAADAGRRERAALACGTWRGIATYDAAVRVAEHLVAERRCRPGSDALRIVAAGQEDPGLLPADAWRVTEQDEGMITMRGAVIVRPAEPTPDDEAETAGTEDDSPAGTLLATVLQGAPPSPWVLLWDRLGRSRRTAAATAAALLAVGGLRVLEALLFRDAVEQVSRSSGALVVVVALLALLETSAAWMSSGLGRRLELDLRMEFARRVPRLGDAYFRTRPASDLTARAHALVGVRDVADELGTVVRTLAQLTGTLVALFVLVPPAWPLVALLGVSAAAVPFVVVRVLGERDHRLRTLEGSLAQFHLDGLIGVDAIRAARGRTTVEWAHERVFAAWLTAARSMANRATTVTGVAEATTTILAVAVVLAAAATAGDGGSSVLLAAFWALSVPVLASQLTLFARALPHVRSVVARALEPMTAPLEPDRPTTHGGGGGPTRGPASAALAERLRGVTVRLRGVSVDAGGHQVLDRVDLEIPPGSHVAVVGGSGSGKSTLLGTILGFHTPCGGTVEIAGMPLADLGPAAVRGLVAWVDPQVRIFDAPIADNVRYGADETSAVELEGCAGLLAEADLVEVAARVGDEPLGEAGSRLSGGERQRVRVARALARRNASLVLLDEAFRGLEGPRRQEMLDRVRRRFAGATLLHATHDVGQALDFDRVVVLEGGRVVEDGDPAALADDEGSRFRALLDAAADLARTIDSWDRVSLVDGRLGPVEQP